MARNRYIFDEMVVLNGSQTDYQLDKQTYENAAGEHANYTQDTN